MLQGTNPVYPDDMTDPHASNPCPPPITLVTVQCKKVTKMHRTWSLQFSDPGPQSTQALKTLAAFALPELRLTQESAIAWYDAWQLFFSHHNMVFQELNLVNFELKEHGYSAFGSGLDKAHTMGVSARTILKPQLSQLITSETRYKMIIETVDQKDGTFQ